jgi:hypothetical protein
LPSPAALYGEGVIVAEKKAAKKSIRDVFGVDYLLAENAPAVPTAQQAGDANEIIKTINIQRMTKVLQQLHSAPDRSGKCHDLVQSTGFDLPLLLKLMEQMEKQQLIRVLERDKFGNNLVQMTQQGQDLFTSA